LGPDSASRVNDYGDTALVAPPRPTLRILGHAKDSHGYYGGKLGSKWRNGLGLEHPVSRINIKDRRDMPASKNC
jgi:hypothetical protein